MNIFITWKTYFFIYRSIEACKTVEQVEKCERLLNEMRGPLPSYLARMALIKKIDLLTTIYREEI